MKNQVLLVGVLLFFFGLVFVTPNVKASKILFLLPVASKSHHNVFEPLIRALGERNHEVVVASPVKSSGMPPNVKTIVAVSLEEIFGIMPNVFEQRKLGRFSAFFNTSSFAYLENACHVAYKNKEFDELIKTESFDVVIIDIMLNYCISGVLPQLKAPYIYLTTLPASNFQLEPIGTHLPPSFIPLTFLEYSDRMDFTERFFNIVLQWLFNIFARYIWIAQSEEIYRQYLGQNVPTQLDIDKNLSMVFMNSHFSMTYPRPLLPDVIEVGGMHCRPSQPLPKDLDDFINGAEHGVIFFSLGSIAKANEMPEEYRKVFLNVFSKLKQRVLWKWETETMENVPPNVMLKKYLPQQDILGHKKIKIFMTHGGLLSIQEAVYHGVPLIGIPLFADQDLNVKKVENAGFGITLEILDLTEEKLESAINKILGDSTFNKRVGELSKLIRDQPQTPIDKAVYWTEYVIRHKGATHLRSAARDLNNFQYHSLDVIFFLLGIIIVIVLSIVKLCRKCFCSKKSDVDRAKKNN